MSSFSFGTSSTTPATTSGFSFGSTAAKKPTTGFSFGGNTSTSSTTGGLFGSTNKSSTGGFSFGGSTSTGTKSGFSFGGGFGSSATNNNANDLQTKANEKLKDLMKPEDYRDQLAMALTCPQMYGDERDTLLAKWNQVQAAWGTGNAFRHPQLPPIKLSAKNAFCRFKAIGYSRMPETKDKDGLVWLQVDKPEHIVREHQNKFVEELQKALGAQLNIAVKVDTVKQLPNEKSEMAVYIQEQLNMSTGAAPTAADTYRVPSSVLYGNLKQIEDKLKTMGISNITNRVAMTEEQINQYLNAPPQGISDLQWSQAKKHNPDPKKLVPVPMLGFEQLARTHTHQRLQCEQQTARLEQLQAKIQKLADKSLERQQKIVEHRKDAAQLARKLLRLICRQEILRNAGNENISKDEEHILANLEHVYTDTKTQSRPGERLRAIKGQLKESGSGAEGLMDREANEEKLSPDAEKSIAKMLAEQQKQLDAMVALIKTDVSDLAILKDDLTTL